MWRRCVLIVFVDTNSSEAISGALRLLGKYLMTRSSAVLSSSSRGAVSPLRLRGLAGAHVEDC